MIDQVEPQPLTMAGNYLVFRAPVEPIEGSGVREGGKELSWSDLLEDRHIRVGQQSANERLIPLPTAGVFAEAVLGRSNSAEKLDITRFWQWQDSPIPLTPTEIASVGTGSRATPEDLKPGQLSSPVLNIVNPPALPNPVGLRAVLGAIATPNVFRDMSGLAGTQGLVRTGMEETLAAATDAGQLASANMRTEAQKAVAMGQIAADIVKSVMGGAATGSTPVQGISGTGATINHAKSMDQRGIGAGGTSGGGGGPAIAAGGTGSNANGTSSTGAAVAGSQFAGSTNANEQAAFQRALWGPVGQSAVEAAHSTLGFTMPELESANQNGAGGGGASSSAASGAGSTVTLFPAPYGDSPAPDTTLMQAFNQALSSMSPADRATLDKVAFTIVTVKLDGANTPRYAMAGVHHLVEHYSGSLLKVAAMYAAFELRKTMRALAENSRPGSDADLYAAARAQFDAAIRTKFQEITRSPGITDEGVTDEHILPKYDRMFVLQNGNVNFKGSYGTNLKGMITDGHNSDAQMCIHGLGYGYLVGALASGAFFDVANARGVWLAGDFSRLEPSPPEKTWPVVRVNFRE